LANVGPQVLETSSRFQFHLTVQKDFVQTVRAVEFILDTQLTSLENLADLISTAVKLGKCSAEVKSVLVDSLPVLAQMVRKYGSPDMIRFSGMVVPLTTKYVCLFSHGCCWY
jgi:bacterioferritin-associated ferredoxin